MHRLGRGGWIAVVWMVCLLPAPASAKDDDVDQLMAALRSIERKHRIQAVRALARHWGERDRIVPTLVDHLARVAMHEEVRQVLRALVHLRNRASCDVLVEEAQGKRLEALAGVFDPAFRRDVLLRLLDRKPFPRAALLRLTAQDFDEFPSAWSAWIQAQPVASRPREGGVPKGTQPKNAGSSFYGLTVARTDVVLLLDASASMNANGQLDRVKQEATNVARSFTAADRYNVVFFADSADAFSRRLVPGHVDKRELALRFIARKKAHGGTDLGAGLRAALRDERVKEIVLFSDGLPTRGRVRTADAALKLIVDRKVRVHVVLAEPSRPPKMRAAEFRRIKAQTEKEFTDLALRTGGRIVLAR